MTNKPFTRNPDGTYRFGEQIDDDQIISLARSIVTTRFRRAGPLSSPRQAADYLIMKTSELEREVFLCIFLDTRHQVINSEILFYGSINGATVHSREVVKRALELNASALILGHNHPSGIAEPSQSDAALTRRLRDALALVDIRLLDHLVIGGTEFVSMSDRGLF